MGGRGGVEPENVGVGVAPVDCYQPEVASGLSGWEIIAWRSTSLGT